MGNCGGVGVCVNVDAWVPSSHAPECAKYSGPVCACNGETSETACNALRKGLNIDGLGACIIETAVPSSFGCSDDTDCPDDQFCGVDGSSCGADESVPSRCIPVPSSCPSMGQSRVGLVARVLDAVSSLVHSVKGTLGLADRAVDAVDAVGDVEGAAGMMSSQQAPTSVPYVCGCDDETYNSICLAHMARISVQYLGRCNQP